MKKIIIILVLFVSLFTLVACGDDLTPTELVDYVVSMNKNTTYTGYTQVINSSGLEYKKEMQYDRKNKIYMFNVKNKTLAPFSDDKYLEEEMIEYYHNNKHYYQEDGKWEIIEKEFTTGIFKYSFKSDYFGSDVILPQTDSTNAVFSGTLLDAKVEEFFGEKIDGKDVFIKVIFDSVSMKLKTIEISYKTLSDEIITITTTINYNEISLKLPIS